MSARLQALTVDEVLALPAMPALQQGAAAIGVSRDTGYELAARGEFPIPVIRIGRSLKVRRQDLLAFLGLENDEAAGAATPTASVEHAHLSTSK